MRRYNIPTNFELHDNEHMQYCSSIWYKSLSVMLKTKLYNQLKIG